MIIKPFICDHCGGEGKITIKGNEYNYVDIVYCPLCGGDIYEEDPAAIDDE